MTGPAIPDERSRAARAVLMRVLPWGGLIAGLALVVAVPWLASFALQRLLVEVLTLFAIALAWNLLAGYGGLVAVGLHVFVGVGSYALFALSNGLGLSPWATLPAAAACSAVFAFVSAWPMFRLSGAYFAVGTWVVAEMMRILAQNTPWLGAGAGMPLEAMAGFDRWTRNASVYWAAAAVGFGALVVARAVLRSRLGLALMSVRDAEAAAEACGVPVMRAKLGLWVICATIVGAAGAIAYMGTLQVTPDASFSLNWTAAAIFIAVLGGVGTIEGPILGTVIYFVLRELFAGYGSWYFIGIGSLAMATMVFAPGGAWSLLPQRRRPDLLGVRRAMPATTVAVAPAATAPPIHPPSIDTHEEKPMGTQHQKYKAAAVQAAPAWLDLDRAVDKTIAYIEEAARAGARIIAFPETWIPGYPWYIWVGTPAWAIARGFVQRYFDNSLSYDSPQARRIAEAARKNNITVVLGLSERDGGSLYIAQWLIGPDGETIAKRRKLRPTHVERTVFGDGDGSHIAVYDREDVGRLGALCCWEHTQPLTKYAMYAQNEQVHVAAWPSFSMYEPFAHALGWEVNNAVSKVYAVEGSCFVLGPCAVISQEMVDELCDTEDKRPLIHAGGGHTVIYGPDGSPLANKIPETQEGILYADIDLGAIGVAKNAADPAGHYARPDVMRLLFNNKPARRVEYFSLPVDPADPATPPA